MPACAWSARVRKFLWWACFMPPKGKKQQQGNNPSSSSQMSNERFINDVRSACSAARGLPAGPLQVQNCPTSVLGMPPWNSITYCTYRPNSSTGGWPKVNWHLQTLSSEDLQVYEFFEEFWSPPNGVCNTYVTCTIRCNKQSFDKGSLSRFNRIWNMKLALMDCPHKNTILLTFKTLVWSIS